jgi:hypothetical protein
VFRFARKHLAALVALLVYNAILFAPLLTGRVLTANDVVYKYEPWSRYKPAGLEIQNPHLIDPPTSYYTLMSLMRHEPGAFHWNPYIASGAPGFGSSASALLSPFIFVPTFVVPLPWVFTGIIFLKLNVAFLLSYGWLRQERVGRSGAAIGALVIAASPILAVRWMWQMTNATCLYPALLWLVRRVFDRRPVPLSLVIALSASYVLAGFPSAIAYGVYLAGAYGAWLLLRNVRRAPFAQIGVVVLGGLAGLLIASPSLVTFARWILRSGYLDLRAQASSVWFPLHHAASLVIPYRLGGPVTWTGDKTLGAMDNIVEATIYVGVIPLALAALGLVRAMTRRGGVHATAFWLTTLVVVFLVIFNIAAAGSVAGLLPGIKYSMLGRLAALLPFPIAFFAAQTRAKRIVAVALAAIVAVELSAFAARFYPFVRRGDADIPATPTIALLRSDARPFRVVPFFSYLWPNTSELFRIEDVRSHFTSDPEYRRLLKRIDRNAWTGNGTYIGFNSLDFNFDDPLVAMLGIRYFVEQKDIDIVKWKARAATVAGVPQSGTVAVAADSEISRSVTVDGSYWAIEVPLDLAEGAGGVDVTLRNGARVVWWRRFAAEDVRAMGRIYVPVRGHVRPGETVMLKIVPRLPATALRATDGGLYFGKVNSPVIFERELPDGRVFRNLAELPRFWPVQEVRPMSDEEFLAAAALDLSRVAAVTDPTRLPIAGGNDARVSMTRYRDAEQKLRTESAVPFFLASSERFSPELAIAIDGRPARPVEINSMFAGVSVPAGRHDVVFSRRIGRGWWPACAAGFAMFLAALLNDFRRWNART